MCAPDAVKSTDVDAVGKRKKMMSVPETGVLAVSGNEAGTTLRNRHKQSNMPLTSPASNGEASNSIRRSHSVTQASSHMTAGTLLSLFFVVLAAYLPFFLSPDAAEATYHLASFDYHADISHFDNTIWTYGTDYLLALVMGLLMWSFPSTKNRRTSGGSGGNSCSHVHTYRSQGMLLCYLLSVLAGGLAHHFYTTLESRAHWSFRFLWTICVGTVTLAPAFMGSIATELNHLDWETNSSSGRGEATTKSIPSIPAWFWAAYAICSTIVVIAGGMSYQRPACDIFMAGVTQSPSTFYVMALLGMGLLRHPIPKWTRVMGAFGFILNAPLFPLYPLLVQYTDWSLAAVNTLLHTVLLISWSTQGICLRRVAIALDEYEEMMMQSQPDVNPKPVLKEHMKRD